MKFFSIIFFLWFLLFQSNAQIYTFKTLQTLDKNTPEWAEKMYSGKAAVADVVKSYQAFYQENEFVKNQHTQNYKYWIEHVNKPLSKSNRKFVPSMFRNSTNEWKYIGPQQSYYFNEIGSPGIMHSNIYCISRSKQDPDLLIAGSEGGGAFVSEDRGNTWNLITLDLPIWSINEVLIDPNDDDVWYISGRTRTYYASCVLYKTEDRGETWKEILNIYWKNDVNRFNIIDAIEVHPDGYVIAGTESGVYSISKDGTVTHAMENKIIHDMRLDPTDPSLVYALARSEDQSLIEFYKSSDGGRTFSKIIDGWYKNDGTEDDNKAHGGRIAISKDHPGLIYVIVAANLKAEDNGYLGVFKSKDYGESFTIPTGHLGAPYSDDHLNLLSSNRDGSGYHQGHFNIGIDINPLNGDQILVGGITMSRSVDGAENFMRITGWDNQGGFPSAGFHADVQDIEIYEDCTIISNDGGIAYSENIFEENYKIETRHIGLLASSFRGYGQGWNADIIVGGTNHNGDRYTNRDIYPEGVYWTIGGGEAPSGTVNPGDNSLYLEKSDGNGWADDITGVIQRRKINGVFDGIQYLSDLPVASNTSVLFSWGSNIEFEPHCYNNWYTGSGNALVHVIQNGQKIDTVATFESPYTRVVNQVKIPRYDPNVIYLSTRDVRPVSIGQEALNIFKSEDKGKTWKKIFGAEHLGGFIATIRFDIDHFNPGRIVVCIRDPGTNHEEHKKVYYTENDGEEWQDIGSEVFKGQELNNVTFYQGGKKMFLGTEIGVYEYDFGSQIWTDISLSSGGAFFANMPKIFYRDSKLRFAFHGIGIWEYDLKDDSEVIVTPTVDKNISTKGSDVFQLECYSFLNHEGAQWEWSFSQEPKTIDSYQIRNPRVEFDGPIDVDVTLTISKNGKTFSKTVERMIQVIPADSDGDGFNIIEDCNDYLASSNPNATEVPDNEIDENCDGVYTYSEFADFQFYDVVDNVDTLWGEGTASPLSINGKGHFFPLVAGDNCLGGETKLASSVGFLGDGKIAAITLSRILRNGTGINKFDNMNFGIQLMEWLNGNKNKRIGFQEGWANRNTHSIYLDALKSLGYNISYIDAPYTFESFDDIDILIYGEDWLDGSQVTDEEVEIYHEFISSGGSALFFGLGWSWPDDLSEYPPNRLHENIGLEWLRGNIKGIEHTFNNYPLYINFAPQFDMDCDGYAIDEDCNDSNSQIRPNAPDIVGNDIDENCNGEIAVDFDEDGFSSEVDCDDQNALINPLIEEVPYNGQDDDCDPTTLDDDLDQDGFGIDEDCDDENAMVNPSSEEIPYNGIDEDCNEMTLDDDLDNDGFTNGDDCNDEDASINPDALDIPNNGIDENCDGEDAMSTAVLDINRQEIKIYPNPTSDIIFVENETGKILDFSLINVFGAKCLYTELLENINILSLSDIPPGVYLVIIDSTIHSKLIVL